MKVFFMDEMVADTRSFSPSSSKPKSVVLQWQDLGYLLNVCEFEPATVHQFTAAHSMPFVRNVMELISPNGFGNKSPAVAKSLPYTTGSMLAAAFEALDNGVGAVSPTSGFHHAGWDYCGGYCTFNGLMVTTVALMEREPSIQVGILDLDQHWGDGTDDIIHALTLENSVVHFHPGQQDAEIFLSELEKIIRSYFFLCDIVLYQAGADPHIDDPLGGWMTTEQLYRRDKIVFQTLKDMKIPVAWNLAGGYQRDEEGGIQPVLDIHNNTMRAFVETHHE